MKYKKTKIGGTIIYSPIQNPKVKLKWWHLAILFGIMIFISIADSLPL